MSKISYRWATPGDIDALVKLRLTFLDEGGQGASAASSLTEAIRAYFSKTLPSGDFEAALAEADSTVIGLSGLVYTYHPPRPKNPHGCAGYILNMYVVPAYRRRGIATRLLEMVVTQAKAKGCHSISLHFCPVNANCTPRPDLSLSIQR